MESALVAFLQLLRALRAAETTQALHFVAVNDSRRVFAYSRALLVSAGDGKDWRVRAASGASQVDRAAPLIQWLEGVASGVAATPEGRIIHPLLPSPEEREEHRLGYPLWLPLPRPDGSLMGALWFERPDPWQEGEIFFLAELADAVAHCWRHLEGRRSKVHAVSRRLWPFAALVAIGALSIPVQRAALAPVEIVARDAEVVAAPIEGAIRGFHVQPNQRVKDGDILFTLDDTDRRARLDVAAKALDVARVEYRQASQGTLGGKRDGSKLAALEAQISLKEIELENARQQLERTRARAGRDGVALLPDVQDYLGRPVAAGERVMLVADPDETEARAWLAVHDLVPVANGAAVRIFLDADPLNPLDGAVVRIHHEAEDAPGAGPGAQAYRVMIALGAAAQARTPRVGAKGTARIDGDRAPLFLYLFRRPIAAVRQTVGF